MQYELIEELKSRRLRQEFVSRFIDTTRDYYRKHIATLKQCSDGLCYDGYLWDCLKTEFSTPKVCLMQDALDALQKKKNVFVLWDLYSHDRVFDGAQLSIRHPQGTFIQVDGSTLAERIICEWSLQTTVGRLLPEDIYCFDESFTWFAIFTHEEAASSLQPGNDSGTYIRLCFYHEG